MDARVKPAHDELRARTCCENELRIRTCWETSVARSNSRRNGLRAHLLLHLRHPSVHRLAGRVLLDHGLGLGADRRGGLGEIERLAERLADMPGRGAIEFDPIALGIGEIDAPGVAVVARIE